MHNLSHTPTPNSTTNEVPPSPIACRDYQLESRDVIKAGDVVHWTSKHQPQDHSIVSRHSATWQLVGKQLEDAKQYFRQLDSVIRLAPDTAGEGYRFLRLDEELDSDTDEFLAEIPDGSEVSVWKPIRDSHGKRAGTALEQVRRWVAIRRKVVTEVAPSPRAQRDYQLSGTDIIKVGDTIHWKHAGTTTVTPQGTAVGKTLTALQASVSSDNRVDRVIRSGPQSAGDGYRFLGVNDILNRATDEFYLIRANGDDEWVSIDATHGERVGVVMGDFPRWQAIRRKVSVTEVGPALDVTIPKLNITPKGSCFEAYTGPDHRKDPVHPTDSYRIVTAPVAEGYRYLIGSAIVEIGDEVRAPHSTAWVAVGASSTYLHHSVAEVYDDHKLRYYGNKYPAQPLVRRPVTNVGAGFGRVAPTELLQHGDEFLVPVEGQWHEISEESCGKPAKHYTYVRRSRAKGGAVKWYPEWLQKNTEFHQQYGSTGEEISRNILGEIRTSPPVPTTPGALGQCSVTQSSPTYRRLKAGEIIKEGDEFAIVPLSPRSIGSYWAKYTTTVGEPASNVPNYILRRRPVGDGTEGGKYRLLTPGEKLVYNDEEVGANNIWTPVKAEDLGREACRCCVGMYRRRTDILPGDHSTKKPTPRDSYAKQAFNHSIQAEALVAHQYTDRLIRDLRAIPGVKVENVAPDATQVTVSTKEAEEKALAVLRLAMHTGPIVAATKPDNVDWCAIKEKIGRGQVTLLPEVEYTPPKYQFNVEVVNWLAEGRPTSAQADKLFAARQACHMVSDALDDAGVAGHSPEGHRLALWERMEEYKVLIRDAQLSVEERNAAQRQHIEKLEAQVLALTLEIDKQRVEFKKQVEAGRDIIRTKNEVLSEKHLALVNARIEYDALKAEFTRPGTIRVDSENLIKRNLELTNLRVEHDALKAEFKKQAAALEDSKLHVKQLSADLNYDVLARDYDVLVREHDTLKAELQKQVEALGHVTAQHETLKGHYDNQRDTIHKKNAAITEKNTALIDLRAEVDHLTRKLQAAPPAEVSPSESKAIIELAQKQSELTDAEQRMARQKEHIADLQKVLSTRNDKISEMGLQLHRQAGQVTELKTEVNAHKVQFEAKQAEYFRLVDRVSNALNEMAVPYNHGGKFQTIPERLALAVAAHKVFVEFHTKNPVLYKELVAGDVVQQGDEFHGTNGIKWKPAGSIGKVIFSADFLKYRRKLTLPAVEVAKPEEAPAAPEPAKEIPTSTGCPAEQIEQVDVGEHYRQLQKGEVILQGDEILNQYKTPSVWEVTSRHGQAVGDSVYRRRVYRVLEEGDVVKAGDEFLDTSRAWVPARLTGITARKHGGIYRRKLS